MSSLLALIFYEWLFARNTLYAARHFHFPTSLYDAKYKKKRSAIGPSARTSSYYNAFALQLLKPVCVWYLIYDALVNYEPPVGGFYYWPVVDL